jgi:membrane-associated protein
MDEMTLFQQVQHILTEICTNLFNSKAIMEVLSNKQFMTASFIALALIVFTETGLLIGFFLPGDSLLVTAGLVAWHGDWPLGLLMLILCASAIIGDTVGYHIGLKAGPSIFKREKSLFFNKDHLLKAQAFYEKHGGKTIILARFVPLIRTFAPVVAGVGKMEYRQFLYFNVFGGIGWVCSMLLIGYSLTKVIDPMFKPIFGDDFEVQKHVEKVIIIVVFLSITPGIWHWIKSKYFHEAPRPEPVTVEAP